jgi:hypothetical protein
LTIEGKRQRKTTQRLEVAQPEPHKVEILKGKGKELGQIPKGNIQAKAVLKFKLCLLTIILLF